MILVVGPHSRQIRNDPYVYKKAFKAGMFHKFHTVWKTGDNGSPLKNYTLLMQEYDIRIAYSTLCPRHAESIADGVGWRSKNTVHEYERRTGEQLWKDAEACVAALNSIKRKNVKKAKGFEAPKVPEPITLQSAVLSFRKYQISLKIRSTPQKLSDSSMLL